MHLRLPFCNKLFIYLLNKYFYIVKYCLRILHNNYAVCNIPGTVTVDPGSWCTIPEHDTGTVSADCFDLSTPRPFTLIEANQSEQSVIPCYFLHHNEPSYAASLLHVLPHDILVCICAFVQLACSVNPCTVVKHKVCRCSSFCQCWILRYIIS